MKHSLRDSEMDLPALLSPPGGDQKAKDHLARLEGELSGSGGEGNEGM